MASNIVHEDAMTVLESLPRLKEAVQGFIASLYEHYFKDRDKNILPRVPERKETGDSETSLEGRGPSESPADATARLTRAERQAERQEERKRKAEEDSKRKAEEKERKAAEQEDDC